MLANGTTLSIADTEVGTFVEIPDIKTIPDLGNEKEKVENTGLNDANKQYEYGIGDYGDLEYGFKFKNSATTDAFRVLKAAETSGATKYFKHTYPDGTTFAFAGQVVTKIKGGGLNAPLEFTAKIALQSDMEVTNPAAQG